MFNGNDAIDLLLQSERVFIDLYHLLIFKNSNFEKEENEENLKEHLSFIIVREWKIIQEHEEYRCFFFKKKLTAISQYNHYVYYSYLNTKEKKESIKNAIEKSFSKIVDRLPVENGVIDYAVQENDNTWIIVLNPFNQHTGPSLFCWKKDKELLENGGLEIRIV